MRAMISLCARSSSCSCRCTTIEKNVDVNVRIHISPEKEISIKSIVEKWKNEQAVRKCKKLRTIIKKASGIEIPVLLKVNDLGKTVNLAPPVTMVALDGVMVLIVAVALTNFVLQSRIRYRLARAKKI